MCCAIWYHMYNLKNVKNTQAEACNFTKINTPPWVFFTFFKLYKWYQIVQRITFYKTSKVQYSFMPLCKNPIKCYEDLYNGVLFAVKLQGQAGNVTKIRTSQQRFS